MNSTTMAVIRAEFVKARERQAQLYHGRSTTPFEAKVGEVMLAIAEHVMTDRRPMMVPATMPTGAGKSTSAAALAVAGWRADPDFSCAFVVETMRGCQETLDLVLDLLTPEEREARQREACEIAIWTTAHSKERLSDDLDRRERWLREVEDDYHVEPTEFHLKQDLETARVIIVTHRMLIEEMVRGTAGPVQMWNGRPRSLVLVDEHPRRMKVLEKKPNDIRRFADAIVRADLRRVDQADKVIPEAVRCRMAQGATISATDVDLIQLPGAARLGKVARAVVARMDEIFNADPGYTYLPTALVDLEEGQYLETLRPAEVASWIDREDPDFVRDTLAFLIQAARGCCFLSRQPNNPTFVAYQMEFGKPGVGFVLLDATADLSGVQALAGVKLPSVPTVNYRHLSTTHLEPPKHLRKMNKVVENGDLSEEYVAWMKKVVEENTTPADTVLVVTHQKLFKQNRLEAAYNTPADWSGRETYVVHWGMGLGSSTWKRCNVVFLFSEFFIPKHAVIPEVLRDRPFGQQDSRSVQGQGLTGLFMEALEAHLLRWSKQLASRGTCRLIDGNGVASPMKLFTSMEYSRLILNLERLFPGAPSPYRMSYAEPTSKTVRMDGSEGPKVKRETGARKRFLELMIDPATPDRISFAQIAERTGMNQKKIGNAFSHSPRFECLRKIRRLEVTGTGRGGERYLVRR